MVDFENGIQRFGNHVAIRLEIAGREVFLEQRRFLRDDWAACARVWYLGEGIYDICGKNNDHPGKCASEEYVLRLGRDAALGRLGQIHNQPPWLVPDLVRDLGTVVTTTIQSGDIVGE